jgi:predicted negative regulator of RcsB-dependent stress response
MAEDYLTDDEQWEAVKRWLAENGAWMLGGVVLGAALLLGWRRYQSHEDGVALQAAAQFSEMTALLERNDRNQSRRIADGIVKDFPNSPYADQARLIVARLFVDDGQLPSAMAPLTEVMTNSKDAELKHIARLRLARVLTDQGKADEAIKMLADDTWGAFAARAHEVRGDAFYAKQDFKSAETEYQAALAGGDASNVDVALLELKIADLAPPPASATAMVPAGTPAAKPPSADLSNKAKP